MQKIVLSHSVVAVGSHLFYNISIDTINVKECKKQERKKKLKKTPGSF